MKGGNYENEICKSLSFWYSEGERDDIFRRSCSSGARFTARKKVGKDTAFQSGDITFADDIGKPLIEKFNIEVKTGYGKRTKNGITRWDILDFIDSKQSKPVLLSFWEQSSRDAAETSKVPLLIFRRNQRSSCICIHDCTYNELVSFYGEQPHHIKWSFLRIMSLQSFFNWIPSIKLYLKEG